MFSAHSFKISLSVLTQLLLIEWRMFGVALSTQHEWLVLVRKHTKLVPVQR